MTGNVLIKNRTPSSDVPYLFGLPKQKTTLLRRTSVLRSKTLAEGEFTSPEHFNFLPESKKSALLRRTSVLRSKTLAEGEFTSPEHFNFLPESKKEVTTYVVTSFLERATRLARGVITPRHAQRATNAPLGRFLASLAPCSTLCPLESKNRRFCAVQAFCAAKTWRRVNSLRPSILISCRNPKKRSQHML